MAVDPPEAELHALAEAVGERDGRLRWVPPEQWHITLAFYGDVPDDVADGLAERLGRAAARTSVLGLALAGAGTFPRQARKALTLWVGVAGDTDALARLADRCAAAGRRCAIPMKERVFRPHLTLARSRRDPVDLRDRVAALASYAGSPWSVCDVRLVHSTLGSTVRHETLASWPLHQA